MQPFTLHLLNTFKLFLALSTLALYVEPAFGQQSTVSNSVAIDKQSLTIKINEALAKLQVVQGLSVAIYSPHGSYAYGFGVTDMQTQEKVSADTAFYIASSTKSMFALLVSIMDEQGKLSLEQSLTDFTPDAPFPKNINAGQITLRHLLSMSSGIKHPGYVHRVAYSGEHDQTLLWDLISKTQANRSKNIRLGGFRYTNWNYNLLARLIEHNTEKTWQQLLQQNIFEKAGMTRTTAYMSVAKEEGWSVARPHVTLGDDAPRRTYLEKTDNTMHAAGGVYMSANDALRWLSIFINNGRINGEQVFNAAAVEATRGRFTQANTSFGKYQREHYGLGWYIGPYLRDDITMVHHFGGFSGARAHVSYLPQKQIGVAIFVNDAQVGGKLVDIVANYIYDSLLDYDQAIASFEQEVQELVAWKQDLNAQLLDFRQAISQRKWRLALPLEAYEGRYVNKEFGTVNVEVDGKTLRITNGNLKGVAQAGTEPNSIRVELLPMEGAQIQFKTAWFSNSIKSLEYEGTVFERVKQRH